MSTLRAMVNGMRKEVRTGNAIQYSNLSDFCVSKELGFVWTAPNSELNMKTAALWSLKQAGNERRLGNLKEAHNFISLAQRFNRRRFNRCA